MVESSSKSKSSSTGGHWIIGLFVIALGIFPVLLATGVIEPQPGQIKAPEWVVVLAGVVFIFAGIMLILGTDSRMNDVAVIPLLLCFAGVAGWAAFLAPGDGMQGGLFFLPRSVNVMIGRVLFGFGMVVCLGMAVHAVRRAMRRSD